jgi:hypothetical protein
MFIPTPQDEQLRLTGVPGSTPITQTATGGTPAISQGPTASAGGYDHGVGFAPGGAGRVYAAVINVTAIKTSVGDETYTFHFQESADGSTWVDITTTLAVTAVGVVAMFAMKRLRYSRLNLVIAGTAPTITYEAWLNPNTGNH